MWNTAKELNRQVFSLVMDGNLTRSEVLKMTDHQRTSWLKLMKERSEKQKEEAEQARARGKGRTPRVPRR